MDKGNKIVIFLIVILLIGFGLWFYAHKPAPSSPSASREEIKLDPADRILVLAPHPDDEVLGGGGIVQRAREMDLPLRVVFFTYGDNNEWSFLLYRKHPVILPGAVQGMGLIRHDEALAADGVLGLAPADLTFLGYPDFRTLRIWAEHWGDSPPARSMLTRVEAVPYSNALRPGAPYKGEEIIRDLTTVLRDFKPTKIFLSHPADYNPDHQALYLFTRVALWDLQEEMKPRLYPYLVHESHWPRPRGFHPDLYLSPPPRLAGTSRWRYHDLAAAQVERKRDAVRAHASQYKARPGLLDSFMRPDELFGDLAEINLTCDPSCAPQLLPAGKEEANFSEEHTEEERAAFVGFKKQEIHLEAGELVGSLILSRPLTEIVGLSLDFFGYRRDRPFARMPKLQLRFGRLVHQVFDQQRPLPADTVKVRRQGDRISLRVPLTVLGNPQRVLIGGRTYLGEVPLDWLPWRILMLPAAD